jgi:hypothetical protein
MGIPRLINDFRGLPSSSQVEVLLRLALELTLVGRETYEPASLALRYPEGLRAVNEVQHHITSHVLALLAADPHRYPDEVLVSVITEQDDPELRQQIVAAFARNLPQPVA